MNAHQVCGYTYRDGTTCGFAGDAHVFGGYDPYALRLFFHWTCPECHGQREYVPETVCDDCKKSGHPDGWCCCIEEGCAHNEAHGKVNYRRGNDA